MASTAPEPSTKEMVARYVCALSCNLPLSPATKKTIETTVAPLIGTIAMMIENLIPIFYNAYLKVMEFWEFLQPWNPALLFPAFFGLVLCFFGGDFLTLIAAIEAYRLTGYEPTIKCINVVVEDLKKISVESKKDDKKDDDNDGVADVLQISNTELVKRKTLLFMRTVDPERLSEALNVISCSFFAVISTLKLQFAKTITLGVCIGEMVEKPAIQFVLPFLEAVLPPDYKKWAGPVMSYTIRGFAVSIAWTIQRVISAFHSAMRGGLMFSRNIIEYMSIMGHIHIDHEKTYLDEILGYGLAFLGLWFQLSMGFHIPFPLNILLLPFTIAEYLLIWTVNSCG